MARLDAHSARPVDGLLDILRPHISTLILTHDNPDPDAIAASIGLQQLIAACTGQHAQIAYGGIIGRAENRALVELLEIDLSPVAAIDFSARSDVIMVDTQPGAGNDSLPPDLLPRAVIDHHHPRQPATEHVPFVDLRPEYGACSTILVEYLDAANVAIDRRLATALFYGIKVDTQDLGRHAGKSDADAYMQLFPLADRMLLPKIQYPTLPQDYFETFHLALERAQRYGTIVIAALDEVGNPNVVAEVADLLLRLEGIEWSVCLGFFANQLLVSLRTSDAEANAHAIVRQAIGPQGTGGGHGKLAGGRIILPTRNRRQAQRARDRLIGQLLGALGASREKPRPLLRLKERELG